MKKTMRVLASFIGGILALFPGSAIGARMQALYMGPPPSMQGKVMDSATSNAIAGLRVELLKKNKLLGTGTTYSDGIFRFTLERKDTNGPFTVRILDVDGPANRAYSGSTNTVPNAYSRQQFYLKKKGQTLR